MRDGRVYGRIRVGDRHPEFRLHHAANIDEGREIMRWIGGLIDTLADAGRLDDANTVDRVLKIASEDVKTKAGRLNLEKTVAGICDGSLLPKTATFRTVGERWTSGDLAKLYPDHVKEKDSSDDRSRLERYIYPHVGDVSIAAFALADAKRVMAALPTMSVANRRHVAQIITRILALSVFPLELIKASPIPAKWLPILSEQKAKAFLYPDEDAKLVSCREIPIEERLLYGVLVREGARVAEIATADWWQFDTQRGIFSCDENKTGSPRVWPMREDVSRALAIWAERHRPAGPAGDGTGEPSLVPLRRPFQTIENLDQLAAKLRDRLKLAGVTREELFMQSDSRMQMRAHDLRATFVTLALAAGKTERWVSARTGHKSSEMISRYYRNTADVMAERGITYEQLAELDELLGFRHHGPHVPGCPGFPVTCQCGGLVWPERDRRGGEHDGPHSRGDVGARTEVDRVPPEQAAPQDDEDDRPALDPRGEAARRGDLLSVQGDLRPASGEWRSTATVIGGGGVVEPITPPASYPCGCSRADVIYGRCTHPVDEPPAPEQSGMVVLLDDPPLTLDGAIEHVTIHAGLVVGVEEPPPSSRPRRTCGCTPHGPGNARACVASCAFVEPDSECSCTCHEGEAAAPAEEVQPGLVWFCEACGRHEVPVLTPYDDGDCEPCVHCETGTAYVRRVAELVAEAGGANAEDSEGTVTCPRCDGRRVFEDGFVCVVCRGSGRVVRDGWTVGEDGVVRPLAPRSEPREGCGISRGAHALKPTGRVIGQTENVTIYEAVPKAGLEPARDESRRILNPGIGSNEPRNAALPEEQTTKGALSYHASHADPTQADSEQASSIGVVERLAYQYPGGLPTIVGRANVELRLSGFGTPEAVADDALSRIAEIDGGAFAIEDRSALRAAILDRFVPKARELAEFGLDVDAALMRGLRCDLCGCGGEVACACMCARCGRLGPLSAPHDDADCWRCIREFLNGRQAGRTQAAARALLGLCAARGIEVTT